MKLTEAIAQHFYEVNYGGNWSDANVKDSLRGVSFEQAVAKHGDANTIALLVHHMDFYNQVVLHRLFGGQKELHNHEDSLKVEVNSEAEWEALKKKYFTTVDEIHQCILQLDEQKLFEVRANNKKPYYKNLHGLVEHIHYHLGQINLLKKLVTVERIPSS